MADKIKVVLTGRPPIKIDPDLWPVIAVASHKWFDNQYEFQANRTSNWTLRARQHINGCSLVYGIFRSTSQFQGEGQLEILGGQRLESGADICTAIQAVAEWMEDQVTIHGDESDGRMFQRMANECIADLPAEDCECAEAGEVDG